MPDGQYEQAVEAAKEQIAPATSSRPPSPSATTSPLDADPFDLYRVPRQADPSPYMYFLCRPG